MNDEGWYQSFVSRPKPQAAQKSPARRETVNEGIQADIAPVASLLQTVEEGDKKRGPPPATIARRAKSYSDFYDVVRAHIKKENKLEREKQRKRYKEKQIKNELEFGNWYAGIKDDLLDASHQEYTLYHDQLSLAEQHLDSLLASAKTALEVLSTLSNNFKAVEAQTSAFQAQCSDLLTNQTRTTKLAYDISQNLQYYTYLEPITRRLNAPGAGRLVGGREFKEMLANLDACLEYMTAHPKHKEAATYRAKYRLLLTRGLTLIRNHFAASLKEVSADVTKRIAERQLNDTTQSALLYAKFRVPAPELKEIGLEIQKRAVSEEGGEAEYQGLMNELYQTYGAARRGLLRPIVAKKVADLSSSAKDLVAFAQSGMSFLRGICADEYELWNAYFTLTSSEDALYEFLEELVEPFYDYLRPRTIHEQQIQKLCELCTLIQTRYMEEDDSEDEEEERGEKLDFGHLVEPAMEDAQSRLAFLTLTTLRNEIENYKPKPEDLEYPAKASKAQNPQTGPVLSGRKNSNGVLAQALKEGGNTDDDLAFASGLEGCYPTLRKAVWLLGRIYRLVHSSIFTDLAHQIVHATTLSLLSASTLIVKQKSPTDANLFLITHLLTLKQQIVAFDIEFVSPDISLDYFASVTNTFWELRERGGLFNPVNLVGMLIPRVVRDMLDAKGEVDGRLRESINELVESFAARMTKALSAKKESMKTGEAQMATLEVRKTIEKDVPFLRRKLAEYVQDPRTKETLVAAVMDKVIENYEDWYEEFNEGAGKTGRKGKGREDEVWGPGAFGEWANGVFDVGRLGFVEDEGGSRRGSLGSV